MKGYLTKSIGIIIFVAILSLLVISPVVAGSTTETANDLPAACHNTASTPTCCISTECPLSQFVPINLSSISNRTITDQKICPSCYSMQDVNRSAVSGNLRLNSQDEAQQVSEIAGVPDYCRSNLASEEPPLSK